MSKRRLRNAGSRPKAFFGESMAAAVAGATVGGMFQLAATERANAVAKENARNEAKTILQNAKDQAQAVKDQTAKSREYQQEAQEFTKEENAQARNLQDNIQKTLQIMAGQQSVDDRLEASKIKVKAGGSTRRRLKDAGYPQFLLRGGNMPFQVTDGGAVLPVGVTPEGYDLYEILGNDHEHYHKTRGGKYKSGVGIKFADGNVVEGEGNQKKNGGELMLVTPDNAYFISKHSINGFNPAEGVKQGLHPLQAYAIQEQEKDIIGINDDGTKKAKFGKRRFLIGGTPNLYDYANMGYPQIGTDTIGDTAVGVTYGVLNSNKRTLKYGGKTRCKALLGDVIFNSLTPEQRRNIALGTTSPLQIAASRVNGSGTASNTRNIRTINPQSFEHTPYNSALSNNSTRSTTRGSFGNWLNRNADLAGSFLSGGFNALGAALSASNARDTANIVADAQRAGSGIMRAAYNSIPLIDMNSIRREDYANAHMIPTLRAVVSHSAQPLAQVDRRLQRTLANAGRYSASGAAAQDKMSKAEVDAQDARNQIYNADEQQKQETRKENIVSLNEAARINAMLDAQANQQYAGDYLNLLKYNNDTKITKILGAAGSTTEGLINSANAIAQGRNAASQSWTNALNNIGLTFSNTLSTMAKRRADLENVMLGSTMSGQVNYLSRFGSRADKDKQKAAIQQALKTENLSPEDKATYEYYLRLLS